MASLTHQFSVQATVRALLLLGSMLTLSFLLFRTDLVITPLVTACVCVGLLVEFMFFVRRTNREVTRFFDSIRHADFSHRVDPTLRGAGFAELGQSMREVVERLQAMRRSGEEEKLRLQALVEHVPVPMFSLIDSDRVVLHNHAARRFFSAAPVSTINDLERYGDQLANAMREQRPGRSALVRLRMEGGTTQRMTLSLTEIVVGQEHQRLATLQNISDALTASELEAWQQMAQVLAHEIMNSLTPVASLADTARTLLQNDEPENIGQARDAIGTVAERADSLMNFVQGYRRFSRLPAPQREPIDAGELCAAMATLVASECEQAGIDLVVDSPASPVMLKGDRQQLEQVLINLLRNAMAAVESSAQPKVKLSTRLDRRGRPVIEVGDSGPGVPEELRERVFVPYFSTREGGSGVGLALTRQVMVAHGGTAHVGTSDLGGAQITLQF